MKLIYQVSNRTLEISAEGSAALTQHEIDALKAYLSIQENVIDCGSCSIVSTPVDHNRNTNRDQAQRLEAQFRTFLERHPGFLLDLRFKFVSRWYEGASYQALKDEFPGVTNTDIGAIRFGLNLPRRREDYEIKPKDEKLNHARNDATWPGPESDFPSQ